LIKQRVAREPVAYILGHKEFWSLDFIVTRNVLIPRPETECLVENVIECSKSYRNNHSLKILELGTGSGAIIVALASEMPFHFYTATDFSFEAIQIARQNALKLISEKKINWVLGDWLSPFKDNTAAFDIILSNPPYIKKNIIQELQPEIYRFEPIAALDGGEDGLDSLKQIIFAAANKLRPGGRLFLEIGYDQKNSIIQIARSCGCYEMPLFKKDYAGNNRIAILRLIS
jgi:release factor glutamine methyltransferase